jgi:hypothetical protein
MKPTTRPRPRKPEEPAIEIRRVTPWHKGTASDDARFKNHPLSDGVEETPLATRRVTPWHKGGAVETASIKNHPETVED